MAKSENIENHSDVTRHPHQQMLKLVAKGFYNELIKYGVREPEVLTVAGHLLDNVSLKSNPNQIPVDTYSGLFSVSDVQDEWKTEGKLSISDISISSLQENDIEQIAQTPREFRKKWYVEVLRLSLTGR